MSVSSSQDKSQNNTMIVKPLKNDVTDLTYHSHDYATTTTGQQQDTNNHHQPEWTKILYLLLCFREKNKIQKSTMMEEYEQQQHNTTTSGDFHDLVALRKFKHIQVILTDTDLDIAEWLFQDCNRPLHHILKYKPPLKVVSMICEVLVDIIERPPELVRDKCGFTPLHVACAHECNITVIARLVNGSNTMVSTTSSVSSYASCASTSSIMSASYSSPFHNSSNRRKKKSLKYNPAAMKDYKYGRLPLHWACISMQRDLDNQMKVVGYLVDIYPDGATMEDIRGYTPLDLLKKQQDKYPVAVCALEGVIRRVLDRQVTISQQKSKKVLSSKTITSNNDKHSNIDIMVHENKEKEQQHHNQQAQRETIVGKMNNKPVESSSSTPSCFSNKTIVIGTIIDNNELSSNFDSSDSSLDVDVVEAIVGGEGGADSDSTNSNNNTPIVKKFVRFHDYIHVVGGSITTASSDTSSTSDDYVMTL